MAKGYTFDIKDNECVRMINQIREEVFIEKEDTASLVEKKVIAYAIIRFTPRPLYTNSNTGEVAGNVCEVMELYVSQGLYRQVAQSKNKNGIEKSIKQAFVQSLPDRDEWYASIQKMQIRKLDIYNKPHFSDGIYPDDAWLESLDLETKIPTPTQDKPKEESKPKEENKPKKEEQVKATLPNSNPRVFIVHGQDHAVRNELKLMLHDMKAIPILLEDVPSGSKTLIELLDKEISNIDFVVVLMIPDDIGSSNKDGATKQPRVRQNVIYEYGIAVGKMSRERIVVIRNKDELEMPSDIAGVRYYEYEHNIKEVYVNLQKEFRAHGFSV